MLTQKEKNSPQSLHFFIPNEAKSSSFVRHSISTLAQKYKISPQSLSDLLLVVGEAFANAVEHSKTEEPIEVQAKIEDNTIVVNIRDQGIGFIKKDQNKEIDVLDERGRGLGLISLLTLSCQIVSAHGYGTHITIISAL